MMEHDKVLHVHLALIVLIQIRSQYKMHVNKWICDREVLISF